MSAHELPTATTKFTLNGDEQRVTHPTNWTAAVMLGVSCGVASARVGCDAGACGACSVLVDDHPHAACSMFAWQLDGRSVETAEHLVDADGTIADIVERLVAREVFQCGFCAPGIMVALAAAARGAPSAVDRAALGGNICRCTGYVQLLEALAPDGVDSLDTGSGAATSTP